MPFIAAGMLITAGVSVYQGAPFKNFWSQFCGSVDAMRRSIDTLKGSQDIFLPALEYGQYQPVLVPLQNWVDFGSQQWVKEVGKARLDLTAQPNTQALSNDEPANVPLTRCALIDAAVRKCFNSEPPIPIDNNVRQKKKDEANADLHAIEVSWDYAADGKTPTMLHYTMVCPYRSSATTA
jgi:hypothetical protein